MLFFRMAIRSLLYLTLLAAAAGVAAGAPTSAVPSEVLNFVPTCAQNCFSSFISQNFNISACEDSPSLQCLCTQTGKSGYTIGEGAVQCLLAENGEGDCNNGALTGEWPESTFLKRQGRAYD